ncbi:hypothetical protein K437DRAFT_276950 [Tilletiaria anomala UBC 951]|uniref:Amino acid transporter transmembrane domain-containing protein n=1 Tax=Tilletiaria anomala (strain ATCC 24038 / CBS 436.72 / UBC 951) TaxID=1037660 RepID=A0A066VAC9_TILAU|nr:uncharacterized protein K437DRAFT_276950 [Tilletiaria anomala UBC 951]KDN35714.1 hypothetical protein K437DRAFT_276950 [Tilletiaria anomala UBC 951]
MVSNLAGLSLEDPGHMPTEYVAGSSVTGSKADRAAFSRQDSHDRIASISYMGGNASCLEEYIHWARLQRIEEEDAWKNGARGTNSGLDAIRSLIGLVGDRRHRNKAGASGKAGSTDGSDSPSSHEKEKDAENGAEGVSSGGYNTDQLDGIPEPEAGKLDARRALRIAGASSVFFLITTDILGPNAAPYAMSATGFATGNILYFVMGVMASYAGLLLLQVFCALDSIRFPIKTYGDLAERLIGKWCRHLFTFLQSIQLIINVGLLCLTNGQSLSQLVQAGGHNLCFTVAVLIWALIGIVFAQIRTLRGLSLFANLAVFMNLAIVFVSMGVVKQHGLNYTAIANNLNLKPPFAPVVTAAFASAPLPDKINGIMNMVFAYGGAMIFPEIMAEMRRPMDFWKGLICAELLIFIAYVLYGNFFYAYSGQYTLGVAFQGMASGPWLMACNVLNIITGVIAAAIYGNIGIKVAYINVIEGIFRGPPLLSRKGQFIWGVFATLYWVLAYVIGSAIPQVNTISGLIAAIAIMNFSYSFPFMLALAWQIHRDSIVAKYVPGQPPAPRDWRRGFFGGELHFKGRTIPAIWLKLWLLVITIGSYTMSVLGMYGSGTAVYNTFQNGGAAATSFGCPATV